MRNHDIAYVCTERQVSSICLLTRSLCTRSKKHICIYGDGLYHHRGISSINGIWAWPSPQMATSTGRCQTFRGDVPPPRPPTTRPSWGGSATPPAPAPDLAHPAPTASLNCLGVCVCGGAQGLHRSSRRALYRGSRGARIWAIMHPRRCPAKIKSFDFYIPVLDTYLCSWPGVLGIPSGDIECFGDLGGNLRRNQSRLGA